MEPIIYINAYRDLNMYNKFNLISNIRDRFKITLMGDNFISDLNLHIANVNFPLNINKRAYKKNMHIAKKFVRGSKLYMAPNVCNKFDYYIYNDFQKKLYGYTVSKSIQLALRMQGKSIKSSCIVVYDSADNEIFDTILQISRIAGFLVFLTEDVKRSQLISDYIIANFGTSPIVTRDKEYAFKNSDFILTTREINLITKVPIWYFDNLYTPVDIKGNILNNATYITPWQYPLNKDVSISLLGALLCQMGENNIETLLKSNDIYIDKIKFNESIIAFK
ncbi:hypothetical protein [Clostridium rectalis]|uniref:hypothetical protein n=1 Tax=Clostridium rectalis TaxID=2040295 RepID=UPI000F642EC4|nr:hypothetical protein [Clostridium rectalis]